jgi:hypothetical protein
MIVSEVMPPPDHHDDPTTQHETWFLLGASPRPRVSNSDKPVLPAAGAATDQHRTALNAQISARRKLVADTQHFLGECGWSVSILHNVSEKRRKS